MQKTCVLRLYLCMPEKRCSSTYKRLGLSLTGIGQAVLSASLSSLTCSYTAQDLASWPGLRRPTKSRGAHRITSSKKEEPAARRKSFEIIECKGLPRCCSRPSRLHVLLRVQLQDIRH